MLHLLFFSGVLFALKVITTKESEPRMVNIGGILVPSRYAAWVELIAIHLLVPNASFMGHLAGILAGFLYTNTFFGTLIDEVIKIITGRLAINLIIVSFLPCSLLFTLYDCS